MIAQVWTLIFILGWNAGPIVITDINSQITCERILKELKEAGLANNGKCVQVK